MKKKSVTHFLGIMILVFLHTGCGETPRHSHETMRHLYLLWELESDAAFRFEEAADQALASDDHRSAELLSALAMGRRVHALNIRALLGTLGRQVSETERDTAKSTHLQTDLATVLQESRRLSDTLYPQYITAAEKEGYAHARELFVLHSQVSRKNGNMIRGSISPEKDISLVPVDFQICLRCGLISPVPGADHRCKVCGNTADGFAPAVAGKSTVGTGH
jgi:rubrerythrin